MKIIIVNSFFSFNGGSSLAAYDTYKLLQKKGNEVYFFSTNKTPFFDNNAKFLNLFPNFSNKPIDFIKNPIKFYYNIEAKQNFEKMLDIVKPDIVHCNVVYYLTSSILEPCFKRKIPVVQTIHDIGFICPAISLNNTKHDCLNNALCSNYNYFNCLFNNCCKNNLEKSLRYTLFNYINQSKKIHSKISGFIVPSNTMKNFILKFNQNISESKIHHINNFFVPETFVESDKQNQDYFLFVGNLNYLKGVTTLLDAFINIPQSIKLHIVGDGALYQHCSDFIEKNNLKNIKLINNLQRNDLIAEYRNCIALIQPAIGFESFGLTTIEAFSCHKPAIVSQSGALPEIVKDNFNGLVFKTGSAIDLKEKILLLKNNHNLALQYGVNAYNSFVENYTEEIYYKKLIHLYNTISKS